MHAMSRRPWAWLRVRFLGHRIYYPFEVVETLPAKILLGRDLIAAFELRTNPTVSFSPEQGTSDSRRTRMQENSDTEK